MCSQDRIVNSEMKISRIFENMMGTSVLIIWGIRARGRGRERGERWGGGGGGGEGEEEYVPY